MSAEGLCSRAHIEGPFRQARASLRRLGASTADRLGCAIDRYAKADCRFPCDPILGQETVNFPFTGRAQSPERDLGLHCGLSGGSDLDRPTSAIVVCWGPSCSGGGTSARSARPSIGPDISRSRVPKIAANLGLALRRSAPNLDTYRSSGVVREGKSFSAQ